MELSKCNVCTGHKYSLFRAITVLLASSLAAAPSDTLKLITRPEPALQTYWHVPSKVPSVKSSLGRLNGSLSWKCNPVIGQSFNHKRKWLLLNVELSGGPGFSFAGLIVAIDGDTTAISPFPWDHRTFLGGVSVSTASLEEQEALIRRIAAAKEVWLTLLLGGGPERYSVELTPQQLAVFQFMLDQYKGL